jgi:2-polyprenyl-3-methyl-5-hydroxy-6-metoxy-1,4-benzoquinol methylase
MNKIQKNTLRHCPICGEEKGEILHTQNFVLPDGHPLAEGYDVICCDRCGFVYADTTVSQKDYDIFYAKLSKYEDNKTSTGGADSPYDAKRLRKTAECIAEFLPDKHLRILDIGCANGGLLGYLKELGYSHLYGIDPSPACVENTQRNYGIEAAIGSLFQLPQNMGKFDLIILSHVLEHIQDIQSAIQSIKQLLNPEGYLYIEVPNAFEYIHHLYAPFQDFNTEHINHFSEHYLNNLFQKNSFINQELKEKIFDIAPQKTYPAVYGFWQRQSDQPQKEVMELDTRLKEKIDQYIQGSKEMMRSMDTKIQEALHKNNEIIVWGTGQLAMKLLSETSLSRATIAAFIDGNPINHGQVISGVEIVSPSQIQARNLSQPILITSTLSQEAIHENIKKMGFVNPIILLS